MTHDQMCFIPEMQFDSIMENLPIYLLINHKNVWLSQKMQNYFMQFNIYSFKKKPLLNQEGIKPPFQLKVKVKSLSHVRPLATPWTAAYQAPPSVGFSRQEYWNGVPLTKLEWLHCRNRGVSSAHG